MTQNTIPAGYRLTVHSWENDGDNGKTEVLSGLSREKTQYYVDLCKLLRVYTKGKRDFGNLYDPSESKLTAFSNAVKLIVDNHPAAKQEFDEYTEESNGVNVVDLYPEFALEDLFEMGLSGGDFYTRVCEQYTVEYIPTDIIIEDVTEQF
jgi:hypothetical protein